MDGTYEENGYSVYYFVSSFIDKEHTNNRTGFFVIHQLSKLNADGVWENEYRHIELPVGKDILPIIGTIGEILGISDEADKIMRRMGYDV